MATVANNNLHLVKAFEAFSAHSERLDIAYQQLEQQVQQLTLALAVARSDRMDQLIEKERLAGRLAQIMEALPALVIVTSQHGFISDCNALAMDAFGDALLGQRWVDVSDDRLHRDTKDATEVSLDGGQWFSVSMRQLSDGGQLIMLTDISDSHHRREQQQRQERLALLGETAARLAHQIRTPLAAAMLYASQPYATDTDRDAVLGRLKTMSAMVDDMLRFAKGTPMSNAPLSTAVLLAEVAEHNRALLPSEALLDISVETHNFTLEGNHAALIGALNNLVANAIQHSPQGGTVYLSDALDSEGNVRLSVRDQGEGVSAHLRDQIFEPFFTTRSSGTGLGLAVVRSVAEAHQGSVAIHSSTVGSVFSLCLPATAIPTSFPPVDDTTQFAISEFVSSANLLHKERAHG